MSRNPLPAGMSDRFIVTPREGRVSRNSDEKKVERIERGHAPRGACE